MGLNPVGTIQNHLSNPVTFRLLRISIGVQNKAVDRRGRLSLLPQGLLKEVGLMRNFMALIILLWIACIFFSCSDKSTSPENQQIGLLYQIRGCQPSGRAKLSSSDSCFSYQFNKDLVIDFCVTANCCPDSNRFSLSYGIRNDTITVVVVDTAAHLCRCICRYVIRGEFKDLPLDHYVFACNYDNKLVYLEHVYRRIAAMKRSGVEGLCAIGKSKWKNL